MLGPSAHKNERRYHNFAIDDANYIQLGSVLNRVRHRTQQEGMWSECGYDAMLRSFEVPEMLESSQLAQDDDKFVWDDEGAEGEAGRDLCSTVAR
jgi:hypothetical protein